MVFKWFLNGIFKWYLYRSSWGRLLVLAKSVPIQPKSSQVLPTFGPFWPKRANVFGPSWPQPQFTTEPAKAEIGEREISGGGTREGDGLEGHLDAVLCAHAARDDLELQRAHGREDRHAAAAGLCCRGQLATSRDGKF